MKELDDLVSGIDIKVRILVEKYQTLRHEKYALENEIQDLKNQLSEQKEKNHRLDEKNKILKLSKTLETKEGNIEAKLKINELVREIDKCIGLLNT